MGYRLNRLDELAFMAVSKPLLTEFDTHHRLESFVPSVIMLFAREANKKWVTWRKKAKTKLV